MNFKATRSGLIIAASLLVCATGFVANGIARAAEGDAATDTAANVGTATDTETEAPVARRHRRHTVKKAVVKPHKVASTKASAKSDDDSADAKAGNGASMPPAVANANAQWPAQTTPDTPNVAAQADNVFPQPEQPASAAPADPQANGQVMASDQLNELDRAATDKQAAAPVQAPITLAKATADVTAPAAEESVAPDNSTWDRTSMIGKVFIALGGMLTMASAVRMFMA